MRNAYKNLIGISKSRCRHICRITLRLILKNQDMRSVFWSLLDSDYEIQQNAAIYQARG
jgi:hypothetical protein